MSDTSAPRRRRRASTNEIVTIYWRDIPAQVTATVAGEKAAWLLEQRFQEAIDKAATVAGLTDADSYVLKWRRDSQPCEGDPEAAARGRAEELEQQYPPERVRQLILSGGIEEAAS